MDSYVFFCGKIGEEAVLEEGRVFSQCVQSIQGGGDGIVLGWWTLSVA